MIINWILISGEQNSGKTKACTDLVDYLVHQGGSQKIITISKKNYGETLSNDLMSKGFTSEDPKPHAIRERRKNHESFSTITYNAKTYLICPRGDNSICIEEAEIIYVYLTETENQPIDCVIFTSRSEPKLNIVNSIYSRALKATNVFGGSGKCLKTKKDSAQCYKNQQDILDEIIKCLAI